MGLSILFVLNFVRLPVSIFILSFSRPLFGLNGLWIFFFVILFSFYFLLICLLLLTNLNSDVDLLNFQSGWWKHLLEDIYHPGPSFQLLPTLLEADFRWKQAKTGIALVRKPIEMKRLARYILIWLLRYELDCSCTPCDDESVLVSDQLTS